jgi:hypothetical protein
MLASTPGHKPWCHGCKNASLSIVTMRKFGVYHLLHICLVYIKSQNKILASEQLLPDFLEVFVYIDVVEFRCFM